MTPELKARFDDFVKVLNLALKAARLDGLIRIVVCEDENISDPHIEVDAFHIEPAKVPCEVRDFKGRRIEEFDGWYVSVARVIPGVYRTRNGDGWPDDVDYDEVITTRYTGEAVKTIVSKICLDEIENTLNAHYEAIEFEKLERDSEEYYRKCEENFKKVEVK